MLSEISLLACSYGFDVLALSETWLNSSLSNDSIFSFLVIVYPRGKIGSGNSEEVWQFMPKITLQLKDVLSLNTLMG